MHKCRQKSRKKIWSISLQLTETPLPLRVLSAVGSAGPQRERKRWGQKSKCVGARGVTPRGCGPGLLPRGTGRWSFSREPLRGCALGPKQEGFQGHSSPAARGMGDVLGYDAFFQGYFFNPNYFSQQHRSHLTCCLRWHCGRRSKGRLVECRARS